jgi:hypothetical protein
MLALPNIFVNKYVPFPYISGWFEATQASETLGFIAAIVTLVLIVLYVFVPQTSGKKIVLILAMLACLAAGKVLNLILRVLRIVKQVNDHYYFVLNERERIRKCTKLKYKNRILQMGYKLV